MVGLSYVLGLFQGVLGAFALPGCKTTARSLLEKMNFIYFCTQNILTDNKL